MIENFSEEELMIIRQELEKMENGLPIFKGQMYDYLKSKLQEVLGDFEHIMPTKCKETIGCIMKIADMSFNNYSHGAKHKNNVFLPSAFRCEYVKMCDEIVEIIKKHNKKWENDDNAST